MPDSKLDSVTTSDEVSRANNVLGATDLDFPPRLIVSSVVRGAELGESHGGLCIADFGTGETKYVLDWNTTHIDVAGRGGDRGLRGIAVVGEEVYVLSSEALLLFDRFLRLRHSFRNPFLKHCHEISVCDGLAYVASTGYDSVIVFDLDSREFIRGFHLRMGEGGTRLWAFDPRSSTGPAPSNVFHLNSVSCRPHGLYFAGLRSGGLLCLRGNQLSRAASLPGGTHNAQPFGSGVLYNDTAANRVCARTADLTVAIPIRAEPEVVASWKHSTDASIARPLFARGLCPLSSRYVGGGFSPSTLAIYDLHKAMAIAQISLSTDVRNAIHGLTVWPFDAAEALRRVGT